MELSTAEFLLLLLENWNRKIEGRTLLQKRAYFVQKIVGQNYCSFRPHFYGPFAPEIDSAISLLVQLGFVKEDEIRFDSGKSSHDGRIRYDYSLTNEGASLACTLNEKNTNSATKIGQAASRITSSGDLDYNQLSLAAKVSYVLDADPQPLTADTICSRAEKLGWDVGQESILPVTRFLQSLNSEHEGEQQVGQSTIPR